MYQEVILEESKSPDNRAYAIDDPNKSHQYNPSCGDDITVAVKLSDDKSTITEIKWAGEGCSISTASTSIMSKLLTGKTVAEAMTLYDLFTELMNSRGAGLSADKLDLLDDASVFTGTSKFPARIKCALLGWVALKGAVENVLSSDDVTSGVASGHAEH